MIDRRNLPALAFVLSAAAAIGFIVAYALEAGNRWQGLTLGVALGAAGIGLSNWASLMSPGDVSEERHRLTSSDEARRRLRDTLNSGASELGRRKVILGAFGAAFAAMAAMLVVPLRSLGPSPASSGLTTSPWRPGRRLVTENGEPVAADSVPPDGLLTVFPEGDLSSGTGPVLLLRLPADQLTSSTVEGGAVGGIVAYSKICTHAGCAVGLFQADSRSPNTIHLLLCPCHQSEFDPLDGAKPVAGPATRSLPQLPMEVDGEGNLVATDGFDRPVGPAFWSWP